MNIKSRSAFCTLFLLSPVFALAGDPIPDIDITIDQSPGGVVSTGTTNEQGEFTVTDLKAGSYNIALSGNGRTIVIGEGRDDKITIASGRENSTSTRRLTLSDYKDGDDLFIRKRPGRITDQSAGSSEPTVRAADYNSSRSNKNTANSTHLDEDSDGDGIPDGLETVAVNPRSAEIAPTSVDDDCSAIAEVITTENSLTVVLSCDDKG